MGEGFHTYDGVKHAEVLAIEQAGEKARAGRLCISILEPCSHQGRTGPCADAVIAAGIARVVACMADPNPAVSGRGFARLRQAGVQVASGLLEEEARPLNDAFAKFIRYKLPLVTLKAGMTLDGKIAPPPEDLMGSAGSGAQGADWGMDYQRRGAGACAATAACAGRDSGGSGDGDCGQSVADGPEWAAGGGVRCCG